MISRKAVYPMKTLTDLLVLSMATWRMTSLLVNEDGPKDVFGKFRSFVGVRYNEFSVPYGTNWIAEMLLCTWCASMWVALVFALLTGRKNFVANWLAISAGAIIIDTYTKQKGE